MIYNRIPITIGEFQLITGPTVSFQYDVVQFLVFSGVTLPEYYTVDFCNEGDTRTIPIENTENGVRIPDELLLTGRRIKAYIVVTGTDAGASETRFEITLPVRSRPERSDIEPTPSEQLEIDELVNALNDGVTRAEDAATDAEGQADRAETAADNAQSAVEHYPKIEDGYWYAWFNCGWVNTGVKAEGVDGKGIASVTGVKTSTSGLVDTYTLTVTYTDGDTDTITFTVTNGRDGTDGVSPEVTIETITGGHRVTITDKDHPTGQSFDVMDGEVSQAELDAAVSQLNQQINSINDMSYESIPYTIAASGNVNWSTGSTSSSSTNSYTDYIDISKYPVIKYKREGFTGNSVVGGIAFYDENKTCIGGQRSLTGQANQGYISELQEITVPHGTKYVRCVAFTDTQTYGLFEIYGRTEIVNDVNVAQNAALGVAELKQSANLVNPYMIMDGLNINNSGTLTSANNRALVYWIPVKEGATYYFTFLTASGSFYGVSDSKAVATAFYSNMCVSNRVGTQGAYVGSFGPAPQGAKYMLMSFPNTYLAGSANDPVICVTENWYPANASEMPVYFTPYYSDKVSSKIAENTDNIDRIVLHNDIVETVSHQGYKVNAPKSTKWAYIAAKQRGYKIAENDINFSSSTNRTLFMWHDETFGVCGDIVDADNGYLLYSDGVNYYWYDSVNAIVYDLDYVVSSASISEMTRVNGSTLQCTLTPWKLIKEIDVGIRLGQKFKGTKVLTFEEWVLLCKQLGLDIYIDRKVNIESCVSDLVGIVKKHGMLDHASWVINTSASIGTAIRAIDPNARLLLITRPSVEQLPALASLAQSGRGLAYDFSNNVMTAEIVTEALTNGIQIESYYVGYGSASEETIFAEIRRLVELGCTRLTLDKYMVSDAYKFLFDDYDTRVNGV